MTYSKRMTAGIAAGLALVAPVQAAWAQAAAPAEKPVQLHVQCDGMPDNVTAGETAARLLGAFTLLALFAPPPEQADPSKRKFGAEGVAVCTRLIDGDKKETNAPRRIGLIMARAIHQIEAKNYEAAIADAALGRSEATAAGLMADPYFARSRGRGFDQIEAAALFRMGKLAEASEAALRTNPLIQYSLAPQLLTVDYGAMLRQPADTELTNLDWRARLYPSYSYQRAAELELLARFADAARVRDAFVDFDRVNTPDINSSAGMAQAAITYALAGNKERAAEQIAEARANAAKRKADGKPDPNKSEVIELFDLYGIIDMSATDAKTARRLFSARSQWVSTSLGTVIEVSRRLREGAAPDELIGGLAHDGSQLWKDHVDSETAEMTAKDKDNATLFRLMPYPMTASAWELMSKQVWNTAKSKILLKPGKPDKDNNSKLETLFYYGLSPSVAMDAYVLHAALLAKSRGQAGFVFAPILSESVIGGLFRSGNRGDPGLPDDLFLDANDVIAKLSLAIPDPDTLKARQKK